MIGGIKGYNMADPKKPEPEIMPPAPDVQPEKRPEEIPQDKDLIQKEAPEKGGIEGKLKDALTSLEKDD
jgi:hypothetical protein